MKKVLFLIFVIFNVFAYSSTKCELKARYAAESISQNLINQGLSAKYNFLGENKENPDLYLYEIIISAGGESAKMFVGANINDGTIFAAESEQNPEFKVVATGVKEIMCKN